MAATVLPRRPTLIASLLLDGALAVIAHLLSYWLRFDRDLLVTFLPGAWSTLPFLLTGQLGALFVVGAYDRRPRIDWLIRLASGVVVGTVVSTIVLALTLGFTGVSRSAFVADAMLFMFGAFAWRWVWVLRARARAVSRIGGDELQSTGRSRRGSRAADGGGWSTSIAIANC